MRRIIHTRPSASSPVRAIGRPWARQIHIPNWKVVSNDSTRQRQTKIDNNAAPRSVSSDAVPDTTAGSARTRSFYSLAGGLHGAHTEEFYQTIKDNNSKWAQEMRRRDPGYFARLADVQKPRLLWVGCADSRIPPTDVTGLLPGDIFVHRNVANLVHPADANFMAVLQYAVEVLEIPEIIVCGHYGCGGVRHAMGNSFSGIINHWLTPIKQMYLKHQSELEAITDPRMRENRLVELNVRTQVMNIASTVYVQKAWKQSALKKTIRRPRIHGVVYDLESGLMQDLDVNETELPDILKLDI